MIPLGGGGGGGGWGSLYNLISSPHAEFDAGIKGPPSLFYIWGCTGSLLSGIVLRPHKQNSSRWFSFLNEVSRGLKKNCDPANPTRRD